MSSDKKRNSAEAIREMEDIMAGLENFLEQELAKMDPEPDAEDDLVYIELEEEPEAEPEAESETEPEVEQEAEPEEFWGEEDLENLQQKEEINMAGASEKKQTGRKRVMQDERLEDWDVPKKRKRESSAKNTGLRKQPENKRRKKKKHGFVKFLIVMLILLALVEGAHYYAVGVLYEKVNYQENSSGEQNGPLKEDGVINILLIGNDSRENDTNGRSDAMILLSISNNTKKIYMTSLLRDMYVEIPGHDGNRLNAAYSFGGPELLMETVEENLDITVNHYVQVNFEAFASLVDAVGGVDLELTSEEVEYVNGYLWEYNILTNKPEGTDYMDTTQSGLLHLNGPQALAYTRNRYIGTDFGRTERQRKVLSAVVKQAPKALIKHPRTMINGILPNLTTNLTQFECYQLSFSAGKLLTYDMEQSTIPADGTYKDAQIRGMSVLEVDFEANKKWMQKALYEKPAE